MKLIFLASLFLLAAEWPTPSVCWPAMNQQFGGAMDTSPLSAIFGQQMLSNQMNAYGMNTMLGNGGGIGRFNPDLIQAYGSNNNNNNEQIQQRAAFSRLGNQAKSKKLSNTKFMLKPTVLVDDAPMEEAIEKFEQEFVVPSQQSPKAAAAATAKPAAVETEKVKQQEERPAAAVKVEETPQKQEVKQQSAAESKQEVVVAEAKHDELVEKIQQQQQQQQTAASAAAEKQADNDHPAVKALQEQEVSEFHAPAHVNYQEPFASVESAAAPQLVAPPTESVRLLNARPSMRMQQRQQQQQQQQQAYDQQFLNNEQQQQQQFQAAQATQQQQQQQSKPLKFKMAQPDNNNVGIESIRSEMTRVLSQRKNSQNVNNGFEDDDDNVAISNMPPGYNNFNKPPYFNQPVYGNLYGNGGYGGYGNNGYTAPSVNTPSYVPNSSDYVPNKPSKPNTDQLAQSFSSLIIIVNSNSNSNLGVNIIDVDLFRAFLSQFASKSVDDVLRDSSLEDKVKAFNRDHEKSSASSDSSDSKDSGKSSGSKDSGKDKSRSRSDRNKYESTTKLSANVPTYSSEDVNPADSHSESTVLLRKNGAYSQANGNPYAYSYVPYQNGGMIVINNVNDNYNKVVKSILSGHGKSINKHDAFVLPLPINEIKRLMEDAIIVNNDNKNRNFH